MRHGVTLYVCVLHWHQILVCLQKQKSALINAFWIQLRIARAQRQIPSSASTNQQTALQMRHIVWRVVVASGRYSSRASNYSYFNAAAAANEFIECRITAKAAKCKHKVTHEKAMLESRRAAFSCTQKQYVHTYVNV
jgi:hypothetical protein